MRESNPIGRYSILWVLLNLLGPVRRASTLDLLGSYMICNTSHVNSPLNSFQPLSTAADSPSTAFLVTPDLMRLRFPQCWTTSKPRGTYVLTSLKRCSTPLRGRRNWLKAWAMTPITICLENTFKAKTFQNSENKCLRCLGLLSVFNGDISLSMSNACKYTLYLISRINLKSSCIQSQIIKWPIAL